MVKEVSQYHPFPSETFQQLGKVVLSSYFLVDGSLILSDGEEYDCQFEIGCLDNGMVYAVVYLQYPTESNVIDRADLRNRLQTDSSKLIGKTRVHNFQLEAKIFHWTNLHLDLGNFAESNLVVKFLVARYDVSARDTEKSTFTNFILINLNLHNFFAPSESVKNKALSNQFNIGSIIASIISEDPSIVEKTEEEIKSLVEKNLENPYLVESISMDIRSEQIGKLFWLDENSDEHPFKSIPKGFLRLYDDKLPNEWKSDQIADWFCVLISIATGVDVRWHRAIQPSLEDNTQPYRQTWVSTRISQQGFTPFISKTGHRRIDRIGLMKDDAAVDFVIDILESLTTTSPERISKYYEVFDSYLGYASADSTDAIFECTLLCTLGERLYETWQKQHSNKYSLNPEIKKARKKLLKEVRNLLNEQREGLQILTHTLVNIQDKSPNEQWEQFTDNIGSSLGHSVGHSLTSRLMWYFEQTGYGDLNIEKQVLHFVNSRNALLHEQTFHSLRKSNKTQEPGVGEEIDNIHTFIPLMIAAILGYEGEYWNKYLGRTQRMTKRVDVE